MERLRLWVKRLIARAEAGTNGYLPRMGWIETRARHLALDENGNAIPWFTYPAVAFLQKRVQRDWRVLEFGSGMGTIWWCETAERVLSLEHELAWFSRISAIRPENIVKTVDDSADNYIRPAMNTGSYDVIVVDGLFRPECLAIAPEMLTDRGIIILDDGERQEYQAAVAELRGRGLRSVEFYGPQPVSKHPGCTTIFYGDDNILGL